MNNQPAQAHCSLATILLVLLLSLSPAHAYVNDGRQFAIEAGLPYLDLTKDPYVLRENWWDGMIKGGERKVIRQQLFRGNDYWFWTGLSDETKKISIYIYDENGNLVKGENFQTKQTAGVRIVPKQTGSYFVVIFAPEENGKDEIEWAVVYAYR